LQNTYSDTMLQQAFCYRTACTALNGVLLHRHQQFVFLRHVQYQFHIQWLDEAHVHHRCIKLFRSSKRGRQHGTERKDRHAFANAPQLALADRQSGHFLVD